LTLIFSSLIPLNVLFLFKLIFMLQLIYRNIQSEHTKLKSGYISLNRVHVNVVFIIYRKTSMCLLYYGIWWYCLMTYYVGNKLQQRDKFSFCVERFVGVFIFTCIGFRKFCFNLQHCWVFSCKVFDNVTVFFSNIRAYGS